MEQQIKQIIWLQFGAAIDSLKKAINYCPDDIWSDDTKYHQIWYMAFHTIFFLDYYLTSPSAEFTPPAPYTMSEMDPAGIIPEPPYTKEQLLEYLAITRKKCHDTIMNLTEQGASEMCKTSKAEIPFQEMLLYNMRHVQHHTAQIHLLFRQKLDSAPGWTFRAED